MCAVSTASTPASIAAANGTSSRCFSVSIEALDRGAAEMGVGAGVAVTGEVLGAGADPPW